MRSKTCSTPRDLRYALAEADASFKSNMQARGTDWVARSNGRGQIARSPTVKPLGFSYLSDLASSYPPRLPLECCAVIPSNVDSSLCCSQTPARSAPSCWLALSLAAAWPSGAIAPPPGGGGTARPGAAIGGQPQKKKKKPEYSAGCPVVEVNGAFGITEPSSGATITVRRNGDRRRRNLLVAAARGYNKRD